MDNEFSGNSFDGESIGGSGKKPERKYSQLLCLHNRIDYRIETSGRSGEISAKMSIAPVCRDCGIAMHFEQPTTSYDETRLWVRLVPGVGGECVPVE